MKTVIKMLSIVTLLATVIACATTTTPSNLPDKYNLDDNLNSMSQMSGVGVSNWRQMDEQSVMSTANGKSHIHIMCR